MLEFLFGGPTIRGHFLPLGAFSPQINHWYHLAVTRSGSTFTACVDGVPIGSATDAEAVPNPNAPLTLGQAENIGFLPGRLDEMTIYRRALAAEEIQAIVDAKEAGK